MQFIDLKSQYEQLKTRIDARIASVLEHGKYIMGPEVAELERELEKYVGVNHAITCANGTDALTLALMAIGVKEGDIVFCPTFTFFATAESIAFLGATPVFVDSEESTFNICPIDLEKRIEACLSKGESKLKAIITVDLFGLPANYSAIRATANKHGLKVIEDAAQGFGGTITDDNGKIHQAGSFGDVSTTSFFPAKPLGCYGDGGAIFTDCEQTANLLRSLRVHGKGSDKYDNVRIGMNSRLDTIQAAVLLEKLTAFPRELELRNELADFYSKKLSTRLQTPIVPKGYSSSWAQYTIIASNRDEIMRDYHGKGIPTVIYYGKCMHQQKAFEGLGYTDDDFPVASRLSNQVFSLPMYPYMNMDNPILKKL